MKDPKDRASIYSITFNIGLPVHRVGHNHIYWISQYINHNSETDPPH